jgi:hypothetical protein
MEATGLIVSVTVFSLVIVRWIYEVIRLSNKDFL